MEHGFLYPAFSTLKPGFGTVVTFHLVVNPPSTSSAGRWDEVLVQEHEDVVTDLPEFGFYLRDVLSD